MRILFTGGGTAGHALPILAVIEALQEKRQDLSFFWLGGGEPERSIAKKKNIPFTKIACGKFRRYFSWRNFWDLWKVPAGIFQSFFLILGFKPNIILSKGGYTSLPVVLAAWLLHQKVIVHESDAQMGLANRVAARFAKKVLLGLPCTESKVAHAIYVGNPIRNELKKGSADAPHFFHFDQSKPILLVMGGSQGSCLINQLIRKARPDLQDVQIIHLVGPKTKLPDRTENYYPHHWLEGASLACAYTSAWLVVSRAGANTLAEIAYYAKPSVLIPLDYGRDSHQKKNARVFGKAGASIVLEQRELNARKLITTIKSLLHDPKRLKKMAAASQTFARPQASQRIAAEILATTEKIESAPDQEKKRIHFIGIGGIGMSALARIYLAQGFAISGSDLQASPLTQDLQKLGAQIEIGEHTAENVPRDTQSVIYNLAIAPENPELKAARTQNIPCLSYPEALGKLTGKYRTICIAGTHGKTTTTALIALILRRAGLDPTVVVGSRLKEFGGSNAVLGQGKYLVIEADEYKRAFLNYAPWVIVITNIEAEHLDYYQDLQDVISAFRAFAKRLPPQGLLVASEKVFPLLDLQKFAKGFKSVDYQEGPRQKIRANLKIPGQHNVENGLAAYATAKSLGIADDIILETFRNYTGAWRRFEIVYDQGVTVIDDYGHHPTEIAATLQGAREHFPGRRIWCVFQPHQWERTQHLFVEFSKAFGEADRVIITKIFGVPGRDEMDTQKLEVLGKRLAQEICQQGKEAIYLGEHHKILEYLGQEIRAKDVIIVMGAGNINQLTPKLIAGIKKAH